MGFAIRKRAEEELDGFSSSIAAEYLCLASHWLNDLWPQAKLRVSSSASHTLCFAAYLYSLATCAPPPPPPPPTTDTLLLFQDCLDFALVSFVYYCDYY